MDVIANNIANVNTTRTPEGGAFKRQLVVFAQTPSAAQTQGAGMAGALSSSDDDELHNAFEPEVPGQTSIEGVQAVGIIDDPGPDRMVRSRQPGRRRQRLRALSQHGSRQRDGRHDGRLAGLRGRRHGHSRNPNDEQRRNRLAPQLAHRRRKIDGHPKLRLGDQLGATGNLRPRYFAEGAGLDAAGCRRFARRHGRRVVQGRRKRPPQRR